MTQTAGNTPNVHFTNKLYIVTMTTGKHTEIMIGFNNVCIIGEIIVWNGAEWTVSKCERNTIYTRYEAYDVRSKQLGF